MKITMNKKSYEFVVQTLGIGRVKKIAKETYNDARAVGFGKRDAEKAAVQEIQDAAEALLDAEEDAIWGI